MANPESKAQVEAGGRAPQPGPRRVVDLSPGMRADAILVVKKKVRRTKANGDSFLLFQLGDQSGQINAILWQSADLVDREISPGDLAHVKGEVQLHQDARQIRVHRMVRADPGEYDVSTFLPSSSNDLDALFQRLLAVIETVQNDPLRVLYDSIFQDPEVAKRYKCAPAGKGWHHAYVGGLLEHVLSMLELGEVMVHQHPSLDRDLLIGGILLHDIGKIEELMFRSYIDYTNPGRLVGHLVQGCILVARHIDRIDGFPEELRSRVLHMIVSHHGSLDRGSPKPPMTLEATVVHLLDHLDSQADAIEQVVKRTNSDDGWSDHVRMLDRYFYSGRPDQPSE